MSQAIRSYKLANDSLSVEVVPEIGAKIVSLRNVLTGREWMWRPRPDAPLFRNEPTDSFDASPLIGADECLPTIARCRWNDRDLPDHGEVWARSWELDEAALAENRIRTVIRLPISPLQLERSISLRQNQLLFEYVLTSLSSKPERFLWAFHPLMPIEAGDQIELPPQIRSVRVASLMGLPVPGDRTWSWPVPMPGVRLDGIDFGSHVPAYAKLFAEFGEGSDGFAAIRNGKERLSFRFDVGEIPVVGLWFTRGAWNGYTHMAIEPTNAPADSLCEVAPSSHTGIQPFQSVRWGFQMVLETFS